MSQGLEARCPTCRSPWKGTGTCARCGTDLLPLMRAAVSAHRARQAARTAAGDLSRRVEALQLAEASERLWATSQGGRLVRALRLLGGDSSVLSEL